ncbi:hypothetical protein ABBQ38_008735 [Trebouxia sp. C0009 RCD-2024]
MTLDQNGSVEDPRVSQSIFTKLRMLAAISTVRTKERHIASIWRQGSPRGSAIAPCVMISLTLSSKFCTRVAQTPCNAGHRQLSDAVCLTQLPIGAGQLSPMGTGVCKYKYAVVCTAAK